MTRAPPSPYWTDEARRITAAAALGLVVALLAYICVELPGDLKQVAPIWLANGVVLTVLLWTDRSRWPLLIAFALAGNIAASLHGGGQLPVALGLSVANVVEYLLSALVLRHVLGRDIDVSRPRDLSWIALVCGLCAPLVSAVIASLVLYAARDADPGRTLVSWGLSNALGLMLVTPSLIAFRQARALLAERPVTRRGWIALALLVLSIVLVFTRPRYPLLFIIPPVLAFVALELEFLGAAAGILILSGLAIGFTAMGLGPVAQLAGDMAERALFLQVFLVVAIFAALPLATINAQRRRLRDLAQEQTRWADMAENLAGVGYWRLNLTTRAMTWSDQMYAIVGVDPGTVIAADEWLAAVHPEDREEARLRYRALIETLAPSPTTPTRLLRPDGQIRHVMGNMVVERDADGRPVTVFGVILDVTAQKAAERSIVESEARFRMLAENGSDILAHSGLDGLVTYVSPSVEHRLGFKPEELIGRAFVDFVHEDDVEAVQTAVRAQFESRGRVPPMRVEYRSRHKDGREIWFEARPTLAFDPATGRIDGVTDIVRDISRRKILEIQLRQARTDAEAAATVKGEFLANMSHELRTPLTAVLGFTQLVEVQPELSDTTRAYVERVSNAGKALRATVNDILDFSKLEAGQVDIKPRPMSPTELAREAIELFDAQARAKGLVLTLSGFETVPEQVLADPDRLRQVLLNLIGNAMKFTEQGGVDLEAGFDPATQRLSFSVVDTGPGVPADRIGHLFQRFSQVDGSATRKHGGTGLGLAICKGLIEAMDGDIGVESREGEGSRFWFSLPAPSVDHGEDQDVEADQPRGLPDNCRVLIVDDNRANRELVRAILGPFGAEMTEAADGDEAISSAGVTPFDVILMDLRMPRVDGRTAAIRIREGGLNARTPILAFSADASTLAIDAVFDGQIAKPLSSLGLIETLARTLATSRV
ncbi:PAS domain S-box protein [Caulobacter sp. ErkDOM-YI]|uniref:PAS domain S-box protein n=1 Tax=unclassified Caulobacter TaxID=2648921 RepID=UPI003AF58EC9